MIKKSGAENRLMEFFPSSNHQQTEENFAKSFTAKDLPEVVAFRKQVLVFPFVVFTNKHNIDFLARVL